MGWHHSALLLVVVIAILAADLPVSGQLALAAGKNTSLNNISTSNGPFQVLMDNCGFRTELDGFNFQNYGKELEATDLTPAEMVRMFGDSVVASRANGKIILTPPAEQWMKMANDAMGSGHCEGMAVLSILMYYNKISPTEFEGNKAINLSIQKELLQREIAYWWTTQVTSPGGSIRIHDSPNAILDTLIKTFKQGRNATEWWVMGIYKLDGSDGHAVTPFAVDEFKNGTARILVYDNNYPKIVKAVEVNRTANTWSYYAAINPNVPSELYTGNASTKNLEIVSVSTRLGQQRCDFCDQTSDKGIAGTKGSLIGSKHDQIWSSGDAHLLITDGSGHRVGFLDSGVLVNEIPNAEIRNLTFGTVPHGHEPFYSIPANNNYNIELNGNSVTETGDQGLYVFSPGAVIGAHTVMNPGQKDNIVLTSQGTNNIKWTYTSTSGQNTVDLTICLKSDKPDDNAYYEFTIKNAQLDENGQVSVELDTNEDKLTVITNNNDNPGNLQVEMKKVDENGEQTFSNNDVTLQKNDIVNLDFGSYNQQDGTVTADVTHEDGETESTKLKDETSSNTETNQGTNPNTNQGSDQGNAPSGPLSCPNNCSSNGICDTSEGTCECFPGWGGADCSTSIGSHLCANGVCDVPIVVHV